MVARMQGSYFFKLMLSHLILTFGLVTLGGGLLLGKTAEMTEKEMQANGLQQLQAIKERLEQGELAKYNAVLLNRALSTVRMEAESEIQYLLDNGKQGNYYRITRLTQDLKTLSMALDHLHNLSFWFKRENFVVDHYFHVSADSSPQQELLASTHIPTHRWFLRSVPVKDAQLRERQLQVLSYIHTLPYMARDEQIKGYMIIDLDVQAMVAALGEGLGDEGAKLAIVDSLGLPIGVAGSWRAQELALISQQSESLQMEDGQALSLLPADQSQFGWRYALVRPQHAVMLVAPRLKQEIWLGAGGFLLIGMLISFLVSRWAYQPFRYIRQRMSGFVAEPLPGAASAGELKWIHQALGSMDKQYADYAANLRSQQWRELVSGQTITSDYLHFADDGQYVGLSLQITPGGEEVARQAFMQIATEQKLCVEALRTGSGELTVICWSTLLSEGDFVACAGESIKATRAALVEGRTIDSAAVVLQGTGMGNVVKRPEDIHLSVTEAHTARKYSYLYGTDADLLYTEIEHREKGFSDVSLEALEVILLGGNGQEMETALSEWEEHLRGGDLSLESVRMVVRQVELMLSRVGMKLEMASVAVEPAVLSGSLSEAFVQFRRMARLISERRHEQRNDRAKRMIGEIQTYIAEHLQDDLSLDDLTAMTGYSNQYICKLFKEELETTFVDYLTTIRLEHAACLLRTTEDAVRVLAERSGFRSSQYFSTKFKGKYGITPLQYRNAMQGTKRS